MKKILSIVSWILFFVMAIAGIVAILSTAVGAVMLCLTSCSDICMHIFACCAISYFISILVLVVVCLIYSIYSVIEKAGHDK
jgi:hypothetical protein